MRRYETTFIVNPQADDAAIDMQVTAVADLIKNDGGKILHERRIGTRRLAYPIAGLVQGFYASLIFDAENSALPKLERHYRLEEPYVRHLTIRFDGPLPPAEEETRPDTAGENAEAEPTTPVEKTDAQAAPEKVEARTDSEAKPVADEPIGEEPAVEEPTPEAPRAAEAQAEPTEQAKPDEPADPADEEL